MLAAFVLDPCGKRDQHQIPLHTQAFRHKPNSNFGKWRQLNRYTNVVQAVAAQEQVLRSHPALIQRATLLLYVGRVNEICIESVHRFEEILR